MTVKASACSEPVGALWSIRYQPSAAESCSPTPTAARTMRCSPSACSLLLRYSMGASGAQCACTECACTECARQAFHEQARPRGRAAYRSATCLMRLVDAFRSVIIDHELINDRQCRHQVDVRSLHPQGPDSRLFHQQLQPWSLGPRGRSL